MGAQESNGQERGTARRTLLSAAVLGAGGAALGLPGAIFFLTEDALQSFRRSSGWAAGAGVEYATPEQGASIGKNTTELDPVVALIFGQQGLIAGATLQGVKYTRIIP